MKIVNNIVGWLGIGCGLLVLSEFAFPALLIIAASSLQLSFVQTKLDGINGLTPRTQAVLQSKMTALVVVVVAFAWMGLALTNQHTNEWKDDRTKILNEIEASIAGSNLANASKLIEKYHPVAKDDAELSRLKVKLELATFENDLPKLRKDMADQHFPYVEKKLNSYADSVKDSTSYKELRRDFDVGYAAYKVEQERLYALEQKKKAADAAAAAKAAAMSAPSPKYDEDPRNIYLYCISNQVGICYMTPAECEEQKKFYGSNERGAPHCKPEACGTAGTITNTAQCKRKGHY